MDAPNPFISNGSCYFDWDEPSPPQFLPCGNAFFGHKACCQAGDMCLSSNACYNGRYGITYLAGCTDERYLDKSCPAKLVGGPGKKLPVSLVPASVVLCLVVMLLRLCPLTYVLCDSAILGRTRLLQRHVE